MGQQQGITWKGDIVCVIAALIVSFGVIAAVDCIARSPDRYSIVHDVFNRDRIDLIVLGEHKHAMSLYWQAEVARRYTDAVVVIGHGNMGLDGRWWGFDQLSGEGQPWEEIVDEVRKRHPYRRIVIVSCNPLHQHLNRKNVTYALDNVWFYPDNILLTPLNDLAGKDFVGDIFDFVEQ